MRECSPKYAPYHILGALGVSRLAAVTRRVNRRLPRATPFCGEPVNVVRGTPACESRSTPNHGWFPHQVTCVRAAGALPQATAFWGDATVPRKGIGSGMTLRPLTAVQESTSAVASRIYRAHRGETGHD